MKRILLSLAVILTAGTAFAAGSTGAFLSDTETSTGNTFTAGAIDLKIDNHSFYNGNECKDVGGGVFQWVGSSTVPAAGSLCTTSWSLDNLSVGSTTIHKFFDFQDVKPSDYSEDTISIHVDNNDSYLCADIKLTSNDENSCTDPELTNEPGCISPGLGLGQLAQAINFVWWADDGDNVLETNEQVIAQGPIGGVAGTVGSSTSFTLADSQTNVWNPNANGGPLVGSTTKYIAKAWCFGTIAAEPLSQDGSGSLISPAGDNNADSKAGTPEDGGYHCDGSLVNNASQTDSLTADVTFNAVQARHNDTFRCAPSTGRGSTLTVTKIINNTHGGNNVTGDFLLFAVGTSSFTQVTSGVPASVVPGTYTVTEDGVNGYQAAFSGDCSAGGQITIGANESKHCTITNNDIAPSITLKKVVTGSLPLDPAVSFTLTLDNTVVPQNTSIATTSNSVHAINEIQHAGYTLVGISGVDPRCASATLPLLVTLDEGDSLTCTITNHKN